MFRSLLAGLSCAPMLTLLLMCASPAEAKRVALVVGYDQYESAPNLQKAVKDARTLGAILPVVRTAREPSFRVAKTFKYERPKTTQRAPRVQTRYRVQTKTPKAPAVAPTIQRSPSIRRGPSRRAPRKIRSRRASGGSCGGCRNSCYVSYRVRSHSRQFVPCMRRCWYQLCR